MVMMQITNKSREQAILGDSPKAGDDEVLDSHDAHHNQMMQLPSDPRKASGVAGWYLLS